MQPDQRDKLIAQLIRHEGLKLEPYQCSAGKWTIGIGRNLDDRGLERGEVLHLFINNLFTCSGITEEAARYLLKNDIKLSTAELSALIPCYPILSDIRQRVLIDMHINLGSRRLSGFRKMLKALEKQEFERVGMEMLDSKWARQVGHRAQWLSNAMRLNMEPNL